MSISTRILRHLPSRLQQIYDHRQQQNEYDDDITCFLATLVFDTQFLEAKHPTKIGDELIVSFQPIYQNPNLPTFDLVMIGHELIISNENEKLGRFCEKLDGGYPYSQEERVQLEYYERLDKILREEEEIVLESKIRKIFGREYKFRVIYRGEDNKHPMHQMQRQRFLR